MSPPQPGHASGPVAPALDRNGSLACDWRDCGRPRRGLGRYCRTHANNYALTGHPVALHIPRRTWAPFVRQAEAFVLVHLRAEHPSIEAAIRFLDSELASAERPTTFDTAHLGYQAALLRAKRHGTGPTEFLARVIAGELADDRGAGEPRPLFASDQHAAHQRARLVLLPKPFGREGWVRRKREPQAPRETGRLSWGVRAYAFKRVNGALGVLALKAADAIRRTA